MAEKLNLKLVEDAVEYKVYPHGANLSNSNVLQDTLRDIYMQIESIIGVYIWQNEPFNLRQTGT